MRKTTSKLAAVILAGVMGISMMGCSSSNSTGTSSSASSQATGETGTAAEEGTTEIPENVVTGDTTSEDCFVIWGRNDEIKNMLDSVYASENPDGYKKIVYVNTGGAEYYQDKLDEILENEDDPLYPDMMGVQINYVQKYVESGYLLSLPEIGITKEDLADQYDFNRNVCVSKEDNKQYASFWQATPGCWRLRADLCEKYLGTTDAGKLQEMFATWDDVIATARKVNEASKGRCKLLSGYDDLYRVFINSRTEGWYGADDVLRLDPQVQKYFDTSKLLYDEDLTYNTVQNDAQWIANMSGDGVETDAVLAYTGCPWYTQPGEDGKDTTGFAGQTILIQGPQSYYWGGTGLAVTKGCSNKELAGKIVRSFTCDKDFMKKLAVYNGDFLNNTVANAELAADDSINTEMMYNDADFLVSYSNILQNMNVDSSIVTADDKMIKEMIPTYVDEYVEGNIDFDTASTAFLTAVKEACPYLSLPESATTQSETQTSTGAGDNEGIEE